MEDVVVCHLSREYNGVADALANSASRKPTPIGFSAIDHPPMADRPVYEIERFVDMKDDRILVHWKGFPNSDDFTWEEETGIRSDLRDDNIFHALMQDLLVVLGLEALDKETPNETNQEPLMSSATHGTLAEQEQAQQNLEIPAAPTSAQPSSTSAPRVQPATVAGPNTDNLSLAANVDVPLVRRFSARVRERQARCCLSRTPSAP